MIGLLTKIILKERYDKHEIICIDNKLCFSRSDIYPVSYLASLNMDEYILFLACESASLQEELINLIPNEVPRNRIVKLCPANEFITKIGRYSYGPLAKPHYLVESVGAFCSFAPGTDVVNNHPMEYITTHPITYNDLIYSIGEKVKYKLQNLHPVDKRENKRIKIGNDVWLGRNVIITNHSNIGDGVIAGAGAVITHDIPDYAIVVGVPAHIVRYRYSPDEILALKQIAWWDWPDEKLCACYEDLYLPIDRFICKHLSRNDTDKR